MEGNVFAQRALLLEVSEIQGDLVQICTVILSTKN